MSKIQHATLSYYLKSFISAKLWSFADELTKRRCWWFLHIRNFFSYSTWNDSHDSRGRKPYIQPHILRPICRLSLLAHRALLLVVVPHHPKKRWLQTLYKCPCDDWNTTLILSGHISTTSILWDAWKHLSTTTEISQQGLFHQFSKMLHNVPHLLSHYSILLVKNIPWEPLGEVDLSCLASTSSSLGWRTYTPVDREEFQSEVASSS